MKFNSKKIKPGDVFYSVLRGRMGSEVYQVKVIEVHDDYALCSWNSNRPVRYNERMFAKLRKSKPKMVKTVSGFGYRLARRGE